MKAPHFPFGSPLTARALLRPLCFACLFALTVPLLPLSQRVASVHVSPAASFVPARLSEHVSARARENTYPLVKLTGGREVLTAYAGPEALGGALMRDEAQLLSLSEVG